MAFDITPEQERIWNSDEELPVATVKDTVDDEFELDEEDTETESSEELEQPDNTDNVEDSDNQDEVDEESKDEEVEDKESDTDKPDDTAKTPEAKSTTEQTFKVKANGMEYDFKLDELLALAPKAMDYTKKMQEIAPWRKTISALKETGFGEQDVNLMIDVLKGNKEAIAAVIKRTGVDTLDLDTESDKQYSPNQYGVDSNTARIQEIVSEIYADPEYAKTERVVDTVWDRASRNILQENPEMIRALHTDIKTGIYDAVAPIAFKMKALDGGTKSDIEYYMLAGQQFNEAQQITAKVNTPSPEVVKAKQEEEKQADIKQLSDKRKAAAPSKKMGGNRTVIDYLDESDDDEKYNEWYAKLQSKN